MKQVYRFKSWFSLLFTVYFLLIIAPQNLVAQAPLISFNPLNSPTLASVVDVVNPYDGTNRLFLVQQAGIIKIYSGGKLNTTDFLNLTQSGLISSGGERGLLSLAFH